MDLEDPKPKLSVPVVKAYKASLNCVFCLASLYFAVNPVISKMFWSFEQSCPPREVQTPRLEPFPSTSVGDPALSLSFWTLLLRPRTLPCLPIDSRSVRFPPLMILCGDWDKLLPCLKKYLARTEQFCPDISSLFISVCRRKKCVSQNTILLMALVCFVSLLYN